VTTRSPGGPPSPADSGVGSGVAVGSGVGSGVAVGSGVGSGVGGSGTGVTVAGSGIAVGGGTGVGAAVAVGSGVGASVAVGTGIAVGGSVGVGTGVAVGTVVGRSNGWVVGSGVLVGSSGAANVATSVDRLASVHAAPTRVKANRSASVRRGGRKCTAESYSAIAPRLAHPHQSISEASPSPAPNRTLGASVGSAARADQSTQLMRIVQ